MAPQKFAGSAGLRVLLAGNTACDLQAATDFLHSEGALGAYVFGSVWLGAICRTMADEASHVFLQLLSP